MKNLNIPRPRGRGPVEAGEYGVQYFPGDTGIPRPRGRGPVEAISWGCQVGHPANIPRPRGRGPVEATGTRAQSDAASLHSAPARARPR